MHPFRPALPPLAPALDRLFATLLVSLSLPVAAQTWAPINDSERQQLEDQIRTQKEAAAAARITTEDQYLAEEKACWQKVLVTACIQEAKQRRFTAIKAIQAQEVDANARQREVNNRVLATREARRQAEAPRKAAEQQEESERYRATQQQAAADREKRQKEKQQEAAAGRARQAAEAKARAERLQARNPNGPARSSATSEEEVRQRVADRDARVAEKEKERLAKERQRAAERAAWERQQQAHQPQPR
jgi:hypothetical protein